MNKDIVNPMEAKNPIPTKCLKVIPWGNWAIFNFTNNIDDPMTPMLLPIKSPNVTPKTTELEQLFPEFPVKATPALAKAKMGIIK